MPTTRPPKDTAKFLKTLERFLTRGVSLRSNLRVDQAATLNPKPHSQKDMEPADFLRKFYPSMPVDVIGCLQILHPKTQMRPSIRVLEEVIRPSIRVLEEIRPYFRVLEEIRIYIRVLGGNTFIYSRT